jgi:hypothetical protein
MHNEVKEVARIAPFLTSFCMRLRYYGAVYEGSARTCFGFLMEAMDEDLRSHLEKPEFDAEVMPTVGEASPCVWLLRYA